MKYYIDTEFLEGTQKEKFPISLFRKNTPPTIDLISIGIVDEDGREYYAISKDFNLEEAWNRYDEKVEIMSGDMRNRFPEGRKYKEYWIRENVLKPIYIELHYKEWNDAVKAGRFNVAVNMPQHKFNYKNMKRLIKRYGKTNKEIAIEIQEFVYGFAIKGYDENETQKETTNKLISLFKENIEFYAYYADYDWVVFCWLFGKMMDLPEGIPKYCKDLKQVFDQKEDWLRIPTAQNHMDLKQHTHYPKQDTSKAHNAIEDARWNKKLHEFLNTL